MKNFIFIFLTGTLISFGQTLTVFVNNSININNGSSLSVDGLELAPDSDYVIDGPNSILRDQNPIVEDNSTSISRVYVLSTNLANYSGVLKFSYLDSELNSIPEDNLVLEVLSGGIWTSVVPVRDQTNKVLTYNFEGFDFTSVTASNTNSTLTINTETLNDFVSVYPNPTTEKLFIVSKTPQEATLFNMAGQKILQSNASELDIINLPLGIYLLNLQNSKNQISTFKIIKK